MKSKLSIIALSLILVFAVFVTVSQATIYTISQFDAIDKAVQYIGSEKTTLWIDVASTPTSTLVTESTITIPPNISVIMESPGSVDLRGNTLVINGPFTAPLYDVFTGSGSVTFGSGSVDYILPNWFGSLNTTISMIGSNPATVRVVNAQTLTANLTVPSTCALEITKTGSIAKASTYTLTINGSFSAGLYRVFSGFNAGDVTFGVGSIKEVYPEWWGAIADGGVTDNIGPITQALSSGILNVYFSGWAYAVSTPVILNTDNMSISGRNQFETIINQTAGFTGDATVIVTGARLVSISNIAVHANASTAAIRITGSSHLTSLTNVVVKFGGAGVYLISGNDQRWTNVLAESNEIGILVRPDAGENTNGCVMQGILSYGSTSIGVDIRKGDARNLSMILRHLASEFSVEPAHSRRPA